jgi:dynein heavy chain
LQGSRKALKDYLELLNKQLDELVFRVRSHLNNNHRSKFTSALIMDIHARDIIETFVRDRSVANVRA